jgi:hypothetical protein
MNEDEERLFKGLDTLRSAAWASFDHRRTYEWKFCIALWTAQAVFIGTLVTQPTDITKTFPLRGIWPVIVTGLIGLAIAAIHVYWSKGISEANTVDRRVSYVYEKKMCPLIGVSHAEQILPIVSPRQNKMGKLINYSHLSQVAITVLLVIGAMCAMWARTR